MKVKLSGNTMTLIEDGDTYTFNGVTEASNGFGFNVNTITLNDGDGDSYQVRGVTSSSVGSGQYHGRFDSGSKQLFLNLESDYVNSAYDIYNSNLVIVANKK